MSPFPVSPQTGSAGGFDLAGLLNNPGFMSMVSGGAGGALLGWGGGVAYAGWFQDGQLAEAGAPSAGLS